MREKSHGTVDRRVQRTRRTLRDALIALILERGWDKISVQDVCDRADVGRSTFYLHYADKEDLLISGLDDLKLALRQQQREEPLGFVLGLIEHAHEQHRLFRAVIGKKSGHVVQKQFRALVIAMMEEDLASIARADPLRDATAHYLAGALVELLTWWIDSKSRLEPPALERLFQRLSRPVLKQLIRSLA